MKLGNFFGKYLTSVLDARRVGKQRGSRFTWHIPYAVFAAVSLFLSWCAANGTVEAPHQHFREGHAVDRAAALFLFVTSVLSIVSWLRCERPRTLKSIFWICFGFGFLFLAADELLMLHEQFGDRIRDSAIGPTESFRNWNDIIVVGYGIAALILAAPFAPIILSYRWFAEFLLSGLFFYCVHTGIDIAAEPPTSTSRILEESAKLFAVSQFALAALAAAFQKSEPS
jgi:hypothetical protein